MQSTFLGIDVGSSQVKAAVYDSAGGELALASARVRQVTPQPGWVEFDAEDVWSTVVGVISTVLRSPAVDPRSLSGIGVSGAGNGLLLLDREGRPCRPAIGSSDSRASHLVTAWIGDSSADLRRSLTRQDLWPGQPPALLAWIRDNEPEVLERARAMIFIKDYVNYRLTSVVGTDLASLSGTSLLDVGRRLVRAELLATYGLSEYRYLLGEPVESSAVIGQVSHDAQLECGLAAGTPVVSGLYDVDASSLGSGVTAPGLGCIIAGTWSINETLVATVPNDDTLFMVKCSAIPSLFLALEGSPTSVVSLDWLAPMLLQGERPDAVLTHDEMLIRMEEMINEAGDSPTRLIFHPFVYGSSLSANARASLIGGAGWDSKSQLLRAVYEGIAFAHLDHVERLRRAGLAMSTFRLTGGGSKSPTWSQMFSDALQATVEVPAAEEVGCLGAAMCAAVGVGTFPSFVEAATYMTSTKRVHTPNPVRFSHFSERFRIYQSSVEALRPIWDELAALGD